MNLQEHIRKVLREEISNSGKDRLKDMIKTLGFVKTSKAVGSINKLKNLTDIHNSQNFLSLFNDLERFESEENPNVFLYRYKKGKNAMVFDERDYENGNVYVYINHDLIFGPLKLFKESEIYLYRVGILRRWLRNNFGNEKYITMIDSFHPGSEDYGFYELLV